MTRFLMGAVTLLFLFSILIIPLDHTGKNTGDSLATRLLEITGVKENPNNLVTITIGGDVMLGRSVMAKALDVDDFNYPFLKIADVTKNTDVTFVNMENAIVENCPKVYADTFKFCGLPEMLEGLNFAGIDVVTLANNHSSNYGESGLEETKTHLENYGIDYVGLDNLVIKEIKDIKFGFLGFYFLVNEPTEGDFKLIRESKKKVDVLIVGVHWGDEYGPADQFSPDPLDTQVEWAQEMLKQGVDVIAGHHPHYVQRSDVFEGKPVYYSLGNLVFDQMWSEQTKTGLLIKLTFKNGEIVEEERINTYMENWAQPKVVR